MLTSLYLFCKLYEVRAVSIPYIILSLRVVMINKYLFTELKINIHLKEDIEMFTVSLFYFFFWTH